jgi:hypothetical protein
VQTLHISSSVMNTQRSTFKDSINFEGRDSMRWDLLKSGLPQSKADCIHMDLSGFKGAMHLHRQRTGK